MKTRTLAATAVVAVFAMAVSAPGALAKPKANLKVNEVKTEVPASTAPGASFTVGLSVRNTGKKAGKGTVRAVLRGASEVLLGSESVNVPAKSKRIATITAVVPAGTAPGGYTFLACLPKGKGKEKCRAGGNVTVTTGGGNPTQYTPGSRNSADPLFPMVGNGGYDARSYDLDFDYDPALNEFNSATATIQAVATQNLSEFSLDFQDLDVSSVTVNGAPATFTQPDASPALEGDPDTTPLKKLVITPAAGIDAGTAMTVRVTYSGTPVRIIDVDGSSEGWIPACYGAGGTAPCDGGFVVNEPNGAQGWFPNNNTPIDKATFETSITVPETHVAFGIGELQSRQSNGDDTWTWNWSEDDLTSTYLTTATVGLFDYVVSGMEEETTGRGIPMYFGTDSSFTNAQKLGIQGIFDQTPQMLNYLSGQYGPYPYDSTGGVQDRTVGVGYALEVQTKPHYASLGSNSASTHLHELGHQWFGNTATLEEWTDIWFNEGWAQYSEWIWAFETQGGDDPQLLFDELYTDTPEEEWEVAPAVLDGDPVNLFTGFPQYDRGSMVVHGTRVILGEEGFAELIDRLMTDYRYGNVSTQEFIALVREISGFTGEPLDTLNEFYEQWLYGEEKPTLLPEDVAPTVPITAEAPSGGDVDVPRGGQR